MKLTGKPWETRFAHDARTRTVLHRDQGIVVSLTVAVVASLLLGLGADLWLGTPWLERASYAVSALTTLVLLAFLFDPRLRAARPPGR